MIDDLRHFRAKHSAATAAQILYLVLGFMVLMDILWEILQ